MTVLEGANRTMVPNSVLLQSAVTPLREPERLELRARFPADTSPSEVHQTISDQVDVPLRYPPHIELEELDHDEVVVKIVAVPERPSDGSRLAAEILEAARTERPQRQAA